MNTKRNSASHTIDVLFALSLFCVFAAASMIVVFIGADVYRVVVDRADTSFGTNTALMYVSTSIRQNNHRGAVRLDRLQDTDAIVLQVELDGRDFETWIYHHDGFLWELFVPAESPPSAVGTGWALLEVYAFSIEMPQTNLISLTASTQEGMEVQKLVRTHTQ